MNPPGKIRVVTAYMEFPRCPTVYVGTTDDGKTIRARYRFGRLVIRLDARNPAPDGGAGGAWIYDQQLDPEGIDGSLDYAALREITTDSIDWPDELTARKYDEDDIIDLI